jgi:hypothetical protein
MANMYMGKVNVLHKKNNEKLREGMVISQCELDT